MCIRKDGGHLFLLSCVCLFLEEVEIEESDERQSEREEQRAQVLFPLDLGRIKFTDICFCNAHLAQQGRTTSVCGGHGCGARTLGRLMTAP